MLPMVTVPEELDAGARTARRGDARLPRGVGAPRGPALGIMVEVPAAAIAIARFDADFYSIGSNDLVQYVTACDRGNGALAALADPLNPAVLRPDRGGGRAWQGERTPAGQPVRRRGGGPAACPRCSSAGSRSLSVSAARAGAR